jgi:hypothetical protein
MHIYCSWRIKKLAKCRKRHSRSPTYSTYFARCRKWELEGHAPPRKLFTKFNREELLCPADQYGWHKKPPNRRKRHSQPPAYSTYFVRCWKWRWQANPPSLTSSYNFSENLTQKNCCATPTNIVRRPKNAETSQTPFSSPSLNPGFSGDPLTVFAHQFWARLRLESSLSLETGWEVVSRDRLVDRSLNFQYA